MDILSALNEVIDYIELNICDDISFTEMSHLALMNEYELSNLFHSLTGMTIKEYIRKRRLTLAAQELQSNNSTIIDVAVKYGYDNADSFRRAFVRQHGVSPKMVRNTHQQINVYPPLSFHIKVEGVNKMKFKIVNIDEMSVFGITNSCYSSDTKRYENARKMWDENCDNIPAQICDGYDGIWYGIWNSSSYTIARDKSNCKNKALNEFKIPAGKYAVFTTEKGGYAGEELPKLHNDIFNSWLPNSKYELAHDLELEVYHLHTDRATRRKNRYYEIWIPIKEKAPVGVESNITIRQAVSDDASSIAYVSQNALGYSCSKALVSSKLRKLNSDREMVFVALVDEKFAGYVHIEKYDVLYCESMTNILGLAVLPEYQHRGVGKALLNKAEEWSIQVGAGAVRLNSGANRLDAHSFYRHMGYDNEKQQIRFMKSINKE